MAEEEAGPTEDEAAELEALLDDTPEPGKAEGKFSVKGIISSLTSNKKMMFIVGGGVLTLLLVIGGVAYYFLFQSKTEQAVEEDVVVEEEPQQEIEKVHMYQLRPFFLPIRTLKDEETGHFLSVAPNLLLSNPTLNREIDKVLPLVRKNVYNILRRKQYKDFAEHKMKTEERVKKEILTASNALLLSGTGTITDVYFSEFIVK